MGAMTLETGVFQVEIDVPSAKSKHAKDQAEDGDLALVRRVKDGEMQAYRELVERYQKRIHSVALGVLGSVEDAEDVAQEAFVKAYKNLHSFRGQSSFYTWLYRITFNLAIDFSRKRYRRSEISSGDSFRLDDASVRNTQSPTLLGKVADPDDALERSEIRKQISKAINSLSPDHRAVIMLREIEGLSYSEISDVVGCSKGTVMSRLHHARKRLQSALAEYVPWKEE